MVDNINEEYIKNKLRKDDIEEKDLLSITELSINKNFDFNNISKFSNLEILILKNIELNKSILKQIANLENLKIIYFKNVVFNNKFKFLNNLKEVYFDDSINFEKIKFKNLNRVEILNSYINNNVLRRIKKVKDIRINNCKISEHIKYNIISKVKVFYLNNVSLETNLFLRKFKNAEVINLNGTNIIGKIEIENMKNEERYFKIREV